MAHDHRLVSLQDLLVLATVPAVLVGVFLLPNSTRMGYVLAYADPTVLTAFSMHFVHLDVGHLLTNLIVYLLVVPVAYLESRRANRRELFWAAFVTFLLVLPFALSGLNLLFDRPAIGFGFSGINMAFLGLLGLFLIAGAGHRPGRTTSVHHAPGLFFAGTGLMATLAVPDPRIRLGLVAAATLAACLYLIELGDGAPIRARLETALRSDGLDLTVAGLAVFLFVPFAAFPTNPAEAGQVLNLYTHFLGYGLGFIAPYATVSILEVGLPSSFGLAEDGRAEVRPTDAD